MNHPRATWSRLGNHVLVVCGAAVWTLGAAMVLVVGLFAAADSRCNGDPPRVDMDGGWLVIATVGVWAAPFVVVAFRRTSVVSVVAALITTAVAVAVLVDTFASPDTFCF